MVNGATSVAAAAGGNGSSSNARQACRLLGVVVCDMIDAPHVYSLAKSETPGSNYYVVKDPRHLRTRGLLLFRSQPEDPPRLQGVRLLVVLFSHVCYLCWPPFPKGLPTPPAL